MSEEQRLKLISQILENADRRCLAYDGAVGDLENEIRGNELRQVYLLSKGRINDLEKEFPDLKLTQP